MDGQEKNGRMTFAVVACGVFISTMDSSMINLALPVIMRDFHASLGRAEWVVLAYLATISASLLFWGRLGDRGGRSRLYLSGILLFLAGSAACAAAPRLDILVSFRLLQGTGAAIMMACGPALVRESTATGKLGRRLGMIGVAVGLGLMCGPVTAGMIMERFSWRFIFLASLVPGIPAAFFAAGLKSASPDGKHQRMDITGAILWAVALFSMTLFLSGMAEKNTAAAAWALASAISGTLLAIRQKRHGSRGFLPTDILSRRYYLMGMISAVISFAVLFTTLFLIPFYLEHGRNVGPSATGMVMLAVPTAAILAAPLAGRLADRFSGPPVASTGLAISTAGLIGLATLAPDTPLPAVWLRMFVCGCGMAVFLSPNSTAVLSRLERAKSGSGAALLATARNIGMLLGTTVSALLFSRFFFMFSGAEMKNFQPEHLQDMVTAMRATFIAAAAIAAAGTAISARRGRPA